MTDKPFDVLKVGTKGRGVDDRKRLSFQTPHGVAVLQGPKPVSCAHDKHNRVWLGSVDGVDVIRCNRCGETIQDPDVIYLRTAPNRSRAPVAPLESA